MPRRKALHEWRPAVQQQIAAALYPKSAQVQAAMPESVSFGIVCDAPLMFANFCILGQPIGKPRMTQKDKWAKRPCVMRYREWADKARIVAGKLPQNPRTVSWTAYFEFPESYSAEKVAQLAGRPHRQKPDRDNVDKALLDSLFAQDCGVSDGTLSKRWDDGNGPRIEVSITFSD